MLKICIWIGVYIAQILYLVRGYILLKFCIWLEGICCSICVLGCGLVYIGQNLHMVSGIH